MKLSTRSRYGTRMMLDLSRHYDEGPVQMGEIANRQNISIKYLEQLIIPLKKANLIKSIRGPKGGHMLSVSPDEVTVGDIVRILEGGTDITGCIVNPELCDKSESCATRELWGKVSEAIYEKLNAVTLAQMLEREDTLSTLNK